MTIDGVDELQGLIEAYTGAIIQQDVGPCFGILDAIARELERGPVPSAVYRRAVRAAVSHVPPTAVAVVWHRVTPHLPPTRSEIQKDQLVPRVRHANSPMLGVSN